nr:unnamed protein product [Callosobruchus analis]
MAFRDNKKFWAEFIHLYREQRVLWDVLSKEYSNKHFKRESYWVLVEKTKEVFPAVDEKFVKSKIESLRASFRRELRKVMAAKKTGSLTDDLYEPLALLGADRYSHNSILFFYFAGAAVIQKNLIHSFVNSFCNLGARLQKFEALFRSYTSPSFQF